MGRVGEDSEGYGEVCWLCRRKPAAKAPQESALESRGPLGMFSRLAAAKWGDDCKNISAFEPKKSVLARTYCSFWLFYHDPRVDGFFKVSEILELRVDGESMAVAEAWLEKTRLDAMVPVVSGVPALLKRKRKSL